MLETGVIQAFNQGIGTGVNLVQDLSKQATVYELKFNFFFIISK